MAKQTGNIQFRGKIGEYSGYVVKGKTGAVVRTINPNMSSRVKTGSEFKNTREYAEKFRVVRFFTNWANDILQPYFRSANITHTNPNWGVKNAIMQRELYRFYNSELAKDTYNPVGYQELKGDEWQGNVCRILNKYSRCKYFTDVRFVNQCHVVPSSVTETGEVGAELVFTPNMFADAIADGFTNIELRLMVYSAVYQRPAGDGSLGLEVKKEGVLISKSFALNTSEDISGSKDFVKGFSVEVNGDNKGHIYCLKYTLYKGSVSSDNYRLQNTGYFCWSGDIDEE